LHLIVVALAAWPSEVVNRRVVVNPRQARDLLTAVTFGVAPDGRIFSSGRSASSLLRLRMPADRGTPGRSGELPVLADLPGDSDQSPMTHQARDFSGRTPSVVRRPASSSDRGGAN
jgi:hypothetical protein